MATRWPRVAQPPLIRWPRVAHQILWPRVAQLPSTHWPWVAQPPSTRPKWPNLRRHVGPGWPSLHQHIGSERPDLHQHVGLSFPASECPIHIGRASKCYGDFFTPVNHCLIFNLAKVRRKQKYGKKYVLKKIFKHVKKQDLELPYKVRKRENLSHVLCVLDEH